MSPIFRELHIEQILLYGIIATGENRVELVRSRKQLGGAAAPSRFGNTVFEYKSNISLEPGTQTCTATT